MNKEVIMNMEFGKALFFLKQGHKLARKLWNGKNMCVFLVTPSKPNHRPYIMMYTADGQLVPWVASQTDILENDWMVVE